MSATIFFEGGGHTEVTQSKCRQGLSNYCAKIKPTPSRLRIVAAGGREQTFDKFLRADKECHVGEIVALLVDSEGPVIASSPVEHLRLRDAWDFTAVRSQNIFLMVQTMEAWFLADRETLAVFYDGGFLPNSLPGDPRNVENIRKDVIEPALKSATRKTKTKGAYHKIEHGAALLGLIDPAKVENASPQARCFHKFLRAL